MLKLFYVITSLIVGKTLMSGGKALVVSSGSHRQQYLVLAIHEPEQEQITLSLQEPVLSDEPSRNASDVRFLLFTRQNPDQEQILEFDNPDSVTNSNFNPNLPTKILVHGYTDNGKVGWVMNTKDGYLGVGEK